jgi:ArsR family transcriptional regulator, arsenate/arsenite/antimonite-responsive transcriptional repressor
MKLNIVNALYALAQDSRLAIFRALVQAGPEGMAAGRISEAVDISPSSVSFHMKELLNAHMVSFRTEGRFVIYAANFDSMDELVKFLTENCCGGKGCLPSINCKPAKRKK